MDETGVKEKLTISDIRQDAIDILNYRISTTTENTDYHVWKMFEILEMDFTLKNGNSPTNGYTGTLAELLFYKAYSNIVGKEHIIISTGDEDISGIDFFIHGYPVDVTIQDKELKRKCSEERFVTLLLPSYKGQYELSQPQIKQEYLKSFLSQGEIDYHTFLTEVVKLNQYILKLMEKGDKRICNVGTNNIANLRTVLNAIYSNL